MSKDITVTMSPTDYRLYREWLDGHSKPVEENKIWKIVQYGGPGGWEAIYKVERIADGEIFTIGDKIKTIYNTNAIEPLTLDKIEVNKNVEAGLALYGEGRLMSISIAKKYVEPKEILLVTEDGKEITDPEQIVYGVDTRTWLTSEDRASWIHMLSSKRKWFSTPEDRQEYIEHNRECLSQKKVNEILSSIDYGEVNYIRNEYRERVKCSFANYCKRKLSKQ